MNNLELAHNDYGRPIHANGHFVPPHITVRDNVNHGTWHVPYYGQTTLGMYTSGETFGHIEKHNLGGLYADKATFRPWK